MSPSEEPPMPWVSSGSSSVPDRYAETVEALRQIGQLSHLCATLKQQVAQLEATKSDHAELEKLRLLLSWGGKESIASILTDLQGRVSSLQGLTSDLQGENGKIRQLEDALGKLEVAVATWKGDVSDQISLQLGSTLQEMKCKLKELEEQQEMIKATLEQLVAKPADKLQEQLGERRATVSSTGQEQAEVQAACPVCSTDISKQVGQLLQRYEQLQEQMDDCMSRQAVGKVVRHLPRKSQDAELLKHIQATITQVQGEYEKLSSVTGNLLNDHHQKQKDIEALFRSLERLEKEKADKEDLVLGIDMKADKSALAGQVSRAQFDASVERLHEMIQEMLSRVTGQEQGLHQAQQQLREEMDSKLDRLELGPFRQQLEEHCRTILEQLKEKAPLTEADDAAGMKKQVLAHFHCMSCDRPLSMLVPGPHIVAIPSMPPLHPNLAGRSHTALDVEETPQHSHRERAAERGYPSVPRRCGGRHTLTHPLQRCPCPQPLLPGALRPLQPQTLPPIKHDEIELLGQDGHIYRGQRGEQLPVLVGKEGTAGPCFRRRSGRSEGGSGVGRVPSFLSTHVPPGSPQPSSLCSLLPNVPRAKPKLSPRQWDTRDTGRLLSRAQSAGSSLSQPGTSTSPETSPASSHGHSAQEWELLPPLDRSSTPEARQDWGAPTEPPPHRPPNRRGSISGQHQ
ncbi:glutamine-rich protein 2 isoform X2 [Athene cunicularia]|uniref:glutamine-rich protein 2 isoform X2 n=1 Tax=Athene cunicularia TaxID=194338 RepID=UPI000EF749AE|nr:glutamine-rich protein 2 isoform X2 [Athene cunicularia]